MVRARSPRPTGWRRARRVALWTVGLLVGLPVGLVLLVLLVVLVGANTGPGQHLIERQVASLTSGMVRLDGLSGRFPDRIRLARLTLSDRLGPYARLDGLVLDWQPLALLHKTADVDLASVASIELFRRPVPSPSASPGKSSAPTSLPALAVDIHRIRIGTLAIAPAVAGTGVRFGVDGHARIASLAPLAAGVSVSSLPDLDLGLAITRQDEAGFVSLVARSLPGRLALHLHGADPPGGLVTALARAPMLDPVTWAIDFDGPRDAEPLSLSLAAGSARVSAHGIVDLVDQHFDLDAHVAAPAMTPRPGLSWQSLALDAHLTGSPRAPAGRGTLDLAGLAAPGGIALDRLTARFDGAEQGGVPTGPAHLHAVVSGLRIPGPAPALLAASPAVLDATLHEEQVGHPLDLTLYHPLAQVTGRVFTSPAPSGTLGITLPDLAPLAAIAHTPLDGHAALGLRFSLPHGVVVAGLGGELAITGGQAQAASLIGPAGHVDLAASLAGHDLRLYQLKLDGQALGLDAQGSLLSNILHAQGQLRLPELAAALPALRGRLQAAVQADGPLHDLAAHVDATGAVGTASVPPAALHLVADASHLPSAAEGHVSLDGTLDRAPLDLAARVVRQPDGATRVVLDRLAWKSASGTADMTLPAGGTLPLGTLDLRMRHLADLSRLAGQKVAGSLKAEIHTSQPAASPAPLVHVDMDASLAAAVASVARLTLTGEVSDPVHAPDIDLRLAATGVRAHGITGGLHATARGPESRLAVAAGGAFDHLAGAPARFDTALVLDVPGKEVAISRLTAAAKGESLRLLAPVRVAFGQQIAVDHLRASLAPTAGGASPASIDLAGKVSPALDLSARVENVTPALARPFVPSLDAAGVLALQARLTGTTARPFGTVRLTAHGLHMRSGPAESLAPANLDAHAELAGKAATIAATLAAGRQVALDLHGSAPLSGSGAIDLHARGHVDLAVANPILGAQARQADGEITLDLGASGTAHAPRLDGTVSLAHGSFEDYAQGLRLTDMDALIRAAGQTLTLDHFVAHAGDGTIEASGTVGALAPGLPVDLHVTAHKARPLASDLLTATLEADITARGQAASRMDVAGTVTIDRAEINIPHSLPASVARLDVIRPGQKAAPATPPGGGSVIGLDVTLNAPGQIFVRGDGLDTVLGGKLHIGGTSTAPVIAGGFDMRTGTFSLASVNLTFTKGRVGFNGAGPTGRIDPSLDFTAESFVGADVARLHIGGYASAPKITLSSNPPLPQDQVLSLILFGQTTTQLSALQIASLAAALAQLSGAGGSGPGVLGTARNLLGLDRLSVGSGGANSSGTSVEAGKYIMPGVYVGARQATSGAGTQAQVQIDLTRHLKLNTVVGTGGTVTGTTTPQNDPGSSVGLTYQFQY